MKKYIKSANAMQDYNDIKSVHSIFEVMKDTMDYLSDNSLEGIKKSLDVIEKDLSESQLEGAEFELACIKSDILMVMNRLNELDEDVADIIENFGGDPRNHIK